jgi:putative hydrolase of the HAD superfamily
MGHNLQTIAFDADDTLWHNERFFRLTQAHFRDLLKDYADPDHLEERLLEAERRNIAHYGFGIKGFVLSMIETALEVTEERVPASVIGELVRAGQEMLRHPIDLMPHAREAIEAVAPDYHVLLITKGDLIDQERKLAQSGLGELFDGVEIVSHKTPEIYQRIFGALPGGAAGAVMVGDSMRSDIVPAIGVGAHGVHIPQDNAWALEKAEAPQNKARYHVLPHLGELATLLESLG